MLDVLVRSAQQHRCSKHSHPHYLALYAKYFGQQREQITSILELGVGDGASVRMWEDYLPNAVITGVDRDLGQVRAPFARATTQVFECDQADAYRLPYQRGPFDLIIDDAGHDPAVQYASLLLLFMYVKPGGCYVIEDLEYSYYPRLDEEGKTSALLQQLISEVEETNRRYCLRQLGKPVPERISFPGLHSIHFYPNIIFLWKD